MRHSLKTGFSFGLTSGIITTLGLMVGLHSGTHSKLAVLGGVLTIAIADSLSDAFGIHLSEETEGVHNLKEIWTATISTFLAKFIFTITFLFPILIFKLSTAILISIIWGLILLSIFSFLMAKKTGNKPIKVVIEHLIISLTVIILTHYLGDFISSIFR